MHPDEPRSPGLIIAVCAQPLPSTALSWLGQARTMREATSRTLEEGLGSKPRRGVFYKGGSRGVHDALAISPHTSVEQGGTRSEAGTCKPIVAARTRLRGPVHLDGRTGRTALQCGGVSERVVFMSNGACAASSSAIECLHGKRCYYPWLVLASKVMEVSGKTEGIGFSHGRAILPHSTTTRPTGSGTQAGLVLWSAEEHAPHSIAGQDRRGCGLL
jgi:hypothetical protein